MKNKDVVISKQIHSSCSTFSSGDVFVKVITKRLELDFTPKVGITILSKKFPMLNGQTITEIAGDSLYIDIYLEADKTFYSGMDFTTNHSNTPRFKEIVNSYINAGFVINRDVPCTKEYRERETIKEQEKAKKKGVVLWMGFEEYQKNPEYFQGGFSDEVFHSRELFNYVKSGCCFGWIGNSSVRTSDHDKQIEKGLRIRGLSPQMMYNWISSSSGRHFADSLGGYTKSEQKQKIEANLNSMFNKCLVFGHKKHQGTLNSTIDIENKYDSFGILLPENLKYNSKDHINNLIRVNEMLSNKLVLTEEEKDIKDIVSEVFANKMTFKYSPSKKSVLV